MHCLGLNHPQDRRALPSGSSVLRALLTALLIGTAGAPPVLAQHGITPPIISSNFHPARASDVNRPARNRKSQPEDREPIDVPPCRPLARRSPRSALDSPHAIPHATGELAGKVEQVGAVSVPPPAPPELSGFPPQPAPLDQFYCSCCAEPAFRLRDDAAGFLPMLRDDARSVVNWNNAAILAGALGTSIAFRQDLDGDVRRNTARHPDRWGEGSKTLGRLGEVQYQVPVIFALYGLSLHRQDDHLHDFSTALISAYTINGLSTLAVKGIANTDRPSDEWNGGLFGFPSFHAASSFTIASVVDEYYGPRAGLPAYALAGLISWSRIDERDHDLSDVFFGAAMGYVIGHAVAGRHLRCDSRVRLLPYFHPSDGTSGMLLDVSF